MCMIHMWQRDWLCHQPDACHRWHSLSAKAPPSRLCWQANRVGSKHSDLFLAYLVFSEFARNELDPVVLSGLAPASGILIYQNVPMKLLEIWTSCIIIKQS